MLETQMAALTEALKANTAALLGQTAPSATQAAPPAYTPPPAAVTPPTFGATAGAMPAAPFGAASFAPTPPPPAPVAPAAGGAPFHDLKGLIDYGTEAYTVMEKKGNGRGAILEELLKHFGADSMNTLNPAHYGAFATEVEKLKAAP